MKLSSINPHDQSIVGELEISSPEEIKETVKKAKKAFKIWREVPIEERVEYIKVYRQKIDENKEKIAKTITLEMGKPIRESLDDVIYELGFLDYYIKNGPVFLKNETVSKSEKEHFQITFEPYGVCAAIAPWNFPLSMVNSGIIPALIAGNTVVLKPSEYTSLSQKLTIDLLNETGIPENVANVLIGGREVGRLLMDEKINLAWFTGSTKVGEEIYKKSSEKFIKAILEMGGSSPAIVFADADLKNAIDNLYVGRFLNCGQVCTAVKRLFVEKEIFEKVVELFAERLKSVKIGNPMDISTDMGPLVSKKQLNALMDQVSDAKSKGAKIETGGKPPEGREFEKGNYFEPTILTNVSSDMKVLTEEVFGPVLPVIPFENEEEVIELANNTPYGLSAEIYTSNIEKGNKLAGKLEAGVVAVNTDNFFHPDCPFGGYKKSGMGREYGKIGMQEFSQVKLLAVTKT